MSTQELMNIWNLAIQKALVGKKENNPFDKEKDFEKWLNFRIAFRNGRKNLK